MQDTLFRLGMRTASELAPSRTARWAANVFFTPRHRSPRVEEALPPPDHQQAVNGAYLRRWGDEANCVFLLHGWEGRYTQFHTLLPKLRQAGYSVLTIDPPAHGQAEGQRSNPGLFAQALLAAAKSQGQPAAVVGHSMGGGGAMLAIKQGLQTQALVLLAAPANVRTLIHGFSQFLGLGSRAGASLRQFIETEVGLPLEALDADRLVTGDHYPPPALILHDRNDRRIPAAHAEEIAQHWPQSTLQLTEGLGHQRLLADEQLASRIVHFIGDQLARAQGTELRQKVCAPS